MTRVRLTRPLLPELDDLTTLLGEVWAGGTLSNGGPLERRFEDALERVLGWPHAVLVASGTVALQLLCRAYDLEGEVIVPALTHPATYQALLWNGLRPIPVDVEADRLTVDVERVAAAVTDRTSAILAVHLFGNPADVLGLERLAARAGLVLLSDAAAAAGTRFDGRPIVGFGHGAAVSLHATKILGVGEGGAVVTADPAIRDRVRSLRNFGLREGAPPLDGGTNGKLSELAAALGLAALPRLAAEIDGRRDVLARYRAELPGIPFVTSRSGTQSNHAYAALRLRTTGGDPAADRVRELLNDHGIDSRRYFGREYRLRFPGAAPSPVADAAADDLLCLPLWGGMPDDLVTHISALVRTGLRSS